MIIQTELCKNIMIWKRYKKKHEKIFLQLKINFFSQALNQKQIEFDKCLRAKRTVEEELDKVK